MNIILYEVQKQTKMICGDRDKNNGVPYGIIDWVSVRESLLECWTYFIIWWVVVTWIGTYVNINWTVHLRFVCLTLYSSLSTSIIPETSGYGVACTGRVALSLLQCLFTYSRQSLFGRLRVGCLLLLFVLLHQLVLFYSSFTFQELILQLKRFSNMIKMMIC